MKQNKLIFAALTALLIITLVGAEISGSPLKKLFNRNSTVVSEVYEPTELSRGLQVTRIGQGGVTAETLADKLKGAGITVSNVTFTGRNLAGGSFAGGASAGFGFPDGVLISSGAATNAIGPNTTASKSTNNQQPGDADLDMLAGDSTFDAAVLEFDFVPQFNKIALNYILASEEYPEAIDYADVMAVFVDGVNITLIPGTATPVGITTINHLVNTQYYVDNLPDNNNYSQPYTAPWDTQADGFTVPLTAVANVTAGQLHHIKIAIADLGDNVYDSWLLMQEDSFHSAADVAVSFTEPAVPVLGTIQDYTITASNNGVMDAQNVVVSFRLPIGSTLQSLPAGVTANSGYYTWTIGTLLSGASIPLQLACLIEILPLGIQVAEISTSTPDNNPLNNRNIPYAVPTGAGDSYTLDEDIPLNADIVNGVLTNDSVYSITAPTAQIVSQPQHGILALQPTGAFLYTPALNYDGSDSFSYRIYDGQNYSSPVQVNLTINPVNDPPVLNLWAGFNIPEDAPTEVNLASIASDPDGDPLTASVTGFDNGGWTANGLVLTLTGNPNWFGSEAITIVISDGLLQVSGETTLTITPVQDIGNSPASLAFGNVIQGETSTQRLYINNTGNAGIDLQAPFLASSNPAFTFTAPSAYSIPPGGNVYTDIGFTPTLGINYNANLSVFNSVFGESPLLIAMSGSAVNLPSIAVSPTQLSTTYPSGSIQDANFTISNTGEATLEWTAELGDGSPAWQTISPLSGSIAGGLNNTITLHSILSGVAAGIFNSSIDITSNASNTPSVTIPITITVTGVPEINITENLIDFGTQYSGMHHIYNLNVHNSGSDVLQLTASTDNTVFSVSPSTSVIPAFSSAILVVTAFSTNEGTQTGNLLISSNASNSPQLQLPLSISLMKPPTITLSTQEITVFTVAETGTTKTFRIKNTGSEPLTWQALAQYQDGFGDWLSYNPALGTVAPNAHQTVTLSFSPAFLDAGEYEATIIINSNDPVSPSVAVSISYYKQDYYSTFYDNNNNANTDLPDYDMGVNVAHNSPLNPVEFNIYANNPEVNSARLVIRAFDVEEALGEICPVTINGYILGILRGQSGEYSSSIFPVNPIYLVNQGKNLIQIAVDTNEAGDGISVHNAQLVINNTILDAQIRYIQPDKSQYIAGENILTTIEIDTQLSTQSLMVETSLLTAGQDLIVSTNRSITINAATNDAFIETLAIPLGLAPGAYILRVVPYDQSTLLQQDMMTFEIELLSNQARISLSANELDFEILPSGITGTKNLIISNTGNLPLSIDSITGQNPGISAVPLSAVVQPGSSQTFAISLQTDTIGLYNNTILIHSNDPNIPISTVNVIAQIIANEPYITCEPSYLDFAECFTGSENTMDLVIRNRGPQPLDVSLISIGSPAFQADVSSFSLGYNQSRTVGITFSPQTPDVYNTSVSIVSNAPNDLELSIPVYASAVLPPLLSLSTASINATVASGGTVYPELVISNVGGSNLQWSAAENLGKCIDFAGYSNNQAQFASIPNRSNVQLAGGAFTVSFWFKSKSNTGGQANGNSVAGGAQYLISKSVPSETGFFGIYIDGQDTPTENQNLVLTLRNPQEIKELRVNDIINLNQWYHISTTYSGGVIRLFLNGTQIATQAVPSFIGNTSPWIVGKLSTDSSRYYRFQGSFDEFRIYSVAKPAQYLVQTMYNRMNSLEPNLTGYWNFNTANINDTTANNNHGSVVGEITYPPAGITDTPSWIQVAPAFGSEPQNTGQHVVLALSAENFMAGNYPALIKLRTNDSNNPQVSIPIQLNVTGSATIDLGSSALSFGDVIIATPKEMQLSIHNGGTDDLSITEILANNPVFAASASTLLIPPQGTTNLTITFLPPNEGIFNGNLTFQTNVSGFPQVTIPLSGNGALAPLLSYNPASFTQNLNHGDAETSTLTISNSQGLALSYSLSLEDDSRSNASGTYYNLSTSTKGMTWLGGKLYFIRFTDNTLNRYNPDTQSVEATWTIHNSPYSITTDGSYLFIASPNGRIYRYTSSGTLINHFSNQLITFTPTIFYRNNSIYACNSNQPGSTIYRISLSGASLGQHSSNLSRSSQIINVPDHDPAPYYALQPSQGRIVRFAIESQVVVPVDTIFVNMGNASSLAHNGRDLYLLEDAKNYMTRIDDGIGEFNWVTLSGSSGSVSAGNSANVALYFSARNAFAGTYTANLHIATNDPVHPHEVIPIQLNVSGQPSLSFSPSNLSYGVCYQGYPTTKSLYLENNGSAELQISNISVAIPFSCPVPNLTIPPWQSTYLPVIYTPVSLGSDIGILGFNTNDPDNPSISINLAGTCTEAPHLEVNPGVISQALNSDQTAEANIQIQNTGITPLNFSIAVDPLSEASFGSSPATNTNPVPALSKKSRLIGDVTHQYPIFNNNSGAVSINDTLYIVSRSTAQIVAYSLSSQQEIARYQIHGDPYGIGFDGTNFWVGDQGGVVYKYPKASLQITIQNQPASFFPTGLGALLAITCRGTDILVAPTFSGSANTIFHQFSQTGLNLNTYFSQLKNITQLCSASVYGDNSIWAYQNLFSAGNVSGGKLLKLSFSGNQVSAIGQQPVWDNALTYTLAHDGNDFLIGDFDGPLMRIDDGIWLGTTTISGQLAAGNSQMISIKLNPAGMNGGAYNGSILISSNDPATPVFELPVSLTVTGYPQISTNPTSAVIDTTLIGNHKTKQIEIQNVGNDILTISSIISSDPNFTISPQSFNLSPSGTRTITVTFTPTSEGMHDAILTISSNSTILPELTLPVSAYGLLPRARISVLPNPYDFGGVYTNASSIHNFTIKNTGNALLTISAVQSASGVFTTTKAMPFTVPIGQQVIMPIRFSPPSPGQIAEEIMVISNSDPLPQYLVPLSGTGLEPLPAIAATPSPLDFGTVVVTAIQVINLNITNTGQLPLVVSNIVPDLPIITCSASTLSIPAGGSEQIQITLTAISSGMISGSLLISSNAANTPLLTVPITGSAVIGSPAISVIPPNLNFGSVLIGSSSTKTILIRNTGNLPLVLSSISTGLPVYTVSQSSAILAPMQVLSLSVTYTPSHPVIQNTQLLIFNNTPANQNFQVPLTGNGQYPITYIVQPSIVDEYTNAVTTINKTLNITNTSMGTLNYSLSNPNPSADWFGYIPAQGSITAGNSVTIGLTMNTQGLNYDLYQTTLRITSNSQSTPVMDIPVYLNYSNYNVTTSDNEDNFGSGNPDYDMDIPIIHNSPLAPVEFNIFTDAQSVSNGQLRIVHQSVLPGEVSKVYFNNQYLGNLAFQPGSIQESYFSIPPASVITGTTNPNLVRITIDEGHINPTGTTVLLGAFDYNKPFQNASIVSLQTEPVVITPDTLLTIVQSLTTNRYAQNVRIVTTLYNSSDQVVLGALNRVIALSAYQVSTTSATWNLGGQVPPGNYHTIVAIYDAVSNDLQDTERLDFYIRPNTPTISVDSNTLNFGSVYIGWSDTKNLVINNLGAATLNISNLHFSNPYFSAPVSTVSIAPSSSYTLPITADLPNIESVNAVLTITSNDPLAPTTLVNLQATGIHPPQIVASPSPVVINMLQYATTEQEITITNTGLSNLILGEITLDGLAWGGMAIIDSLLAPSQSVALTLAFNSVGLEHGLYLGSLQIPSNDPAIPVLLIPVSVDITPRPVIAEFNAVPLTGLSPLTVQFESLAYTTDGSSITTWEWDFDNNGSIDSYQTNPLYTYQIPGNYSVGLRVLSDGRAQHFLLKSNYIYVINNAPAILDTIPEITLYEDGILENLDLSDYFYDPDNDPITYTVSENPHLEFVISGSLLSIIPQPDYNGSESITITASDYTGASVSQSVWVHTISVNDEPWFNNLPPEMAYLRWTTLAVDFAQYIEDGDSNIDMITISISGNVNTTYSINGLVVSFASLGDWFGSETITVTIDDNYRRETASASITLIVLEGLEATFYAEPTEVLAGIPVQFTNTVQGNPTHFEWDFNNDGVVNSTEPNPQYVYNLGGFYSVRLKVMFIAGNDTLHVAETIRPNYIHVIGTHVPGGNLLDDWVLAGSPYNITAPVLVPATSSPIWHPNVQVNVLSPDVFIKVEGSLQVNSVDIFTRYNDRWKGFIVEPNSGQVSFNNMTINNAEIPFLLKSDALITGCTIQKDSLVTFINDWAIQIAESAEPNLSDLQINDYSNGIQIDSPIMASQPTISNIRVRNSSNSIRTVGYGLKVLGKGKPVINNLEIIDYAIGAYYEGDNSVMATPVLISNIRVRNSTNSIRNLRTGIWVKNFANVTVTQDSIINCGLGLIIENTLPALAAQATISNIRVRNSNNSIRIPSNGISITGNIFLRIYDVDLDDYTNGIVAYGTNAIYAAMPTLSNIRVRNSTNSIRETQREPELNGIGIYLKDFHKITVANDSIYGYWQGLKLENSNPALVSQPTLSNIRVRNSTNAIRNVGTGIHAGPGVQMTLQNSLIQDYGVGVSAIGNGSNIFSNRFFDNDNALLVQAALPTFKFSRNELILSPNYPLITASAIKAANLNGITINNNTIINYPAVLWSESANLTLTQNIGWSSVPLTTPIINTNSILNIRYNNIRFSGGNYPGTGNINSDPLFVDETAYDYHLTYNSPCIDAGDPAWEYDEDESIADIGAYVYLHDANFTSDMRFVLPNTLIQFTNTSIGHPMGESSYAWDFNNDGFIDSQLENPSYTFIALGRYHVKLIISSGVLTDTLLLQNYILVQSVLLPAPQNVQLHAVENDIRLSWDPVTSDLNGNPITPNFYIVYASPQSSGQFRYIGQTTGTPEYSHFDGGMKQNMFYIVIAFTGTREQLELFLINRPYIEVNPVNHNTELPERTGEFSKP